MDWLASFTLHELGVTLALPSGLNSVLVCDVLRVSTVREMAV